MNKNGNQNRDKIKKEKISNNQLKNFHFIKIQNIIPSNNIIISIDNPYTLPHQIVQIRIRIKFLIFPQKQLLILSKKNIQFILFSFH